jgi:hypothetical protein
MKRYQGYRTHGAVDVLVNGKQLNPRFDLWNHSPTGFEWGYGGSGPAQLALALLADCLGDDATAVNLHQRYKEAIVSRLPYRGWGLSEAEIVQVVEALQ